MRIAYVTNVRLPTERAHGHQVARVCDALVALGHDVTVFAPFRKNPIRDSFHAFHGTNERVQVRHLGKFDPIDHPLLPKLIQLPLLNQQLRSLLVEELHRDKFDVIYTRTPALIPALVFSGIPIILELHALPRQHRKRFIRWCHPCALIVCLTRPMRDELVSWGVPEGSIIVEGDAVHLERFNTVPSVDNAKRELNLPLHTPVIGYAGQLHSMGLSKGLPELLDAMDILKMHGRTVHLAVAGPDYPPHVNRIAGMRNAVWLGFLPHDRIPTFLAACDILVYPAPGSLNPFHQRDTSPLKIFEYMAAGKPIVAADLPPIRDPLDENTAFFCKPGDPEDLARAIEEVLSSPEQAHQHASAAREKAKWYTWENRMRRILTAYSATAK